MLGGAGLVHSEMPTEAFQQTGGRRHGFQIWVNLSRADKALAPRYKDVPAATIPVVQPADGVTARVLAGTSFGVPGPVHTVTPWTYVHVTLAPGARLAHPFRADGPRPRTCSAARDDRLARGTPRRLRSVRQ